MYQVDEHTISLLHFDDGIKDECGRTWVSNNAVTTDSQKVFGASALAVDVEKYIYTDAVSQFDFTGAFTIEMWAILTSYPTAHSGLTTFSLFSQFADVPNNIDFYIGGATATVIGCSYRVNNVSNSPSFGAAYKFNLNTWYHIAFVSDGSKYYIFVNGKKICEYVPTTKLPLLNTKRACLGKPLIPSIEYDCIGYIDEFRISNVARWTDNFTPGMPEVSKALLVITMTDGERKEYELSKTEVDAFISWYATKDAGSGNPYYTFNKQFNLGPFQSRTDYLAFDKIQDFEVKVF